MKIWMIAAIFVALAATAGASDTYVNGHYRSDGTYVKPHYRTTPDSSSYNNYSTRGNINPHTGQFGKKKPYYGTTGTQSWQSQPYGKVKTKRLGAY